MRAAIVHYWLLNRRGGEKVLDSLCRLLPEADIYTLFCDPQRSVKRCAVIASPRRFSILCAAGTARCCP